MRSLSSSVAFAAYRAQQLSLLLPALAAQRGMRMVTGRGFQPEKEHQRAVQKRYRALLDTDFRNARDGLYPQSLLFQFPLTGYAKAMPHLVRDVPRTLRRLRSENFRDLPTEAEPETYPHYYQRNFHWQTDGYLSDRSAKLYDVGVEWLFLGTADIMRRQVIPPITRFLQQDGSNSNGSRNRLLDIGCGTGRALKQIGTAHPRLKLAGLDLSPFYIKEARELLADHPDVAFHVENGERVPFRDEVFDIVTSVFMFHELPKDARHAVMREMMRSLVPGGLLVIADSAQSSESPDLAPFLGRFTVDFHEPYYKSYQNEPIEDALEHLGFEVSAVESHFVTKVVVARKPS